MVFILIIIQSTYYLHLPLQKKWTKDLGIEPKSPRLEGECFTIVTLLRITNLLFGINNVQDRPPIIFDKFINTMVSNGCLCDYYMKKDG